MKSKFNIVDFIIIIVLLAAIVAGCFMFFKYKNNKTSGQSSFAKVEFVIEVNNLDETTVNSFKDAEGKSVIFGETSSGSGTITYVEIVPYKRWVQNSVDGVYMVKEVPGKYTANVTIQSDVEKTSESFTSGEEIICVGKPMSFNSFGVAAEGCYIVDLSEIE